MSQINSNMRIQHCCTQCIHCESSGCCMLAHPDCAHNECYEYEDIDCNADDIIECQSDIDMFDDFVDSRF